MCLTFEPCIKGLAHFRIIRKHMVLFLRFFLFQKIFDIGVGRGEKVFLCAVEVGDTVFDKQNMVGNAAYAVHVMGDEDSGHMLIVRLHIQQKPVIRRDVIGSSPEVGSS